TNRGGESCTQFDQRQSANVVVTVAKEIECDERDRLCLVDLLDLPRAAKMNSPLQALKSRRVSLVVAGDNLGIQEQWCMKRAPQRFDRTDQRRELRRLVVAEPRPEVHAARI